MVIRGGLAILRKIERRAYNVWARRPALASRDLGAWTLDRLVLYRSQPGPRGSVYTPLAAFPLGVRRS